MSTNDDIVVAAEKLRRKASHVLAFSEQLAHIAETLMAEADELVRAATPGGSNRPT